MEFSPRKLFPVIDLGFAELGTSRLYRTALAEGITLFLFVFIGCGSVVAMARETSPGAALICIATAHGLTIAALAGATSAISGGHINPAVTAAMVATGKITIIRGAVYVGAQLLGAVLGAAVLWGVVPLEWRGTLGSHTINPELSPFQALIIEIILTFTLVFVIFGNAVDAKGHGTIAPILIGFTVTADILCGGYFSGGSMNPARSFGPALISGTWEYHWVYWLGPILGGVLAGIVYHFAFLLPSQKMGTEGGGIEEVTPGVLLHEIRMLKGALSSGAPIVNNPGNVSMSIPAQGYMPAPVNDDF